MMNDESIRTTFCRAFTGKGDKKNPVRQKGRSLAHVKRLRSGRSPAMLSKDELDQKVNQNV